MENSQKDIDSDENKNDFGVNSQCLDYTETTIPIKTRGRKKVIAEQGKIIYVAKVQKVKPK